jgi:flagellin-like hook-associated protein FlgL
MSDKPSCCDLTPTDDCNKTCCPDYVPDDNWCKAFNKRSLEQQQETTRVMMDGMWFNIQDARNTIAQGEQYLTMIYELLLASHDQVMKASVPSRTEGDFESASNRVKELVKEVHAIADSAQYNGRSLLQNTKSAEHDNKADTDHDNKSAIVFRLAGARGFCRNVGAQFNDFTYDLPAVGATGLGLDGNTNLVLGNKASNSSTTGEHNYLDNGLNDWNVGDDEGIVGPDSISSDNVDQTVSDFNCAIKTVGVELDKLRAYRYILCLREKQIRIWKSGQETCFDHKCKI